MATHSCILVENPMDRGAWQATVHGFAKSWTRLKRLSMNTQTALGKGGEKTKTGLTQSSTAELLGGCLLWLYRALNGSDAEHKLRDKMRTPRLVSSHKYYLHYSWPLWTLCGCLVAKSCPTLCNLMECSLWPPLSMGVARQEHWSPLPTSSPGVFLTQGWNPCLLHLLHWQVDSWPLSQVKNLPANAGDMGSPLVRHDPTCLGATKPRRHNYWSPSALEAVLCNQRGHGNENPAHHKDRKPEHSYNDPAQPKRKKYIKLKKEKRKAVAGLFLQY